MLTILTTTDHKSEVEEAINSVDRLTELVDIAITTAEVSETDKLLVVNSEIKVPMDWYDSEPPYLFPAFKFSENNLLAIIFFKLGNHQKSFEYVGEKDLLYNHLLIATHLQFGYEISKEMLQLSEDFKHNKAIINHYGNLQNPIQLSTLEAMYKDAIENSVNDEVKLFSGKHFINLLLDHSKIKEAIEVIRKLSSLAISSAAQNAMDVHSGSVLISQLKLPYNDDELTEILSLRNSSIAFYESRDQKVLAGLMLMEAAEIANFQRDFMLSKQMINKAINYFREEDIPEFLGDAGLKKAVLLYTWSKNGQPQYYKAAINAFQDTLKVFKKESHPEKFAEVHHNLALIYSEMPSSEEEKGIWSAFSASSFKNALEVYSKENYPYQFAMASHNYATALMNFPPAKIHNNLEKASGFFENALEIRTSEKYPFERGLTLLNQLELYWLTHNEDIEAEEQKYLVMVSKANEVKTLLSDKDLVEQANGHLERLEKLKEFINKN